MSRIPYCVIRLVTRRSIALRSCSAAMLFVTFVAATTEAAPSLFEPAKKASTEASANQPNSVPQMKPARGPATSKAVKKPVASSESEKPSYVMRLDVTVKPGQDLETAYFEYLNDNRVHPKVLRAKVRRVANDEKNPKRHEEVVAILRSALRTGQVQRWMYEALGLAMQMNQMPADEIERTLMSAADFTTNPQETLYLADYMARLGYKERALQILQEVSERMPGNPQAYQVGLSLAKDLKDDDAIMWASLGVLKQAWPANQRQVADAARRSAMATIARLRREGKKEVADGYARQLRKAQRRDVIVKVTWHGEADVDLAVEEPGGSVCSYRNARSSNGGVLIGDANSKLDRSAGEGYSETYVCPEGFSGTYRILVRQVWGRIPAGKVTVQVWLHRDTKDAVHEHRSISLDENGAAMVVFDLKSGHRTGSIEAERLANDVTNQRAVNRAVLAQMINSAANNPSLLKQQTANQQQQPFVIGAQPFANGRGGVGYRPEVILLPSGATMSVTAVISADRRYVRTTALPFFSQILDVSTFNFNEGIVDGDADGDVDGDVIVDVGVQQ